MFYLFKNLLKPLALFLLLQAGYLFSQADADFTMAGYAANINIYNIRASEDTTGPVVGGFMVVGTQLPLAIYTCQVSFNGGGAWNTIGGEGSVDGDPLNGTISGVNFLPKNDNDDVQIWYSHAALANTTGYPGSADDLTMTIRIIATGGVQLPDADGRAFDFDLVAPTLASAVIRSNNSDPDWAKTGDVITVTLTATAGSDGEDLGSPSSWGATIQNRATTVAGTARSWTIKSTVGDHEEGNAAFAITYYDLFKNPGSVTAPLNSSLAVNIDKTPPIITATIQSDDNVNNTSALATTSDDVTLTITAVDAEGDAEIIQVPTVTISGTAPTAINPSVVASSYIAMRTMVSGDDQGSVVFEISDLKDRAGNVVSNITAPTSGSNVRFDSVVPTLESITIISNNSINEETKAKTGDIVTVSFETDQDIPTGSLLKTPVVTIDGEGATVVQDANLYAWTATKLMDAEDSEGDVSFSIGFMDLAGNSGVAVTAVSDGTNINFDRTSPTINSTALQTTNNNNQYATIEDVITTTIVSAEALYSIKDVTVALIPVATQTTNLLNKTSWTVSYTLTGAEGNGGKGCYYKAVDLAGNITTVPSGNEILVDNTAPILNTIEIFSNNDDITQAKIGDVVTIKVVADEPLLVAPVITIQGRTASVSNVGTTYSGAYTMLGTDTEGAVAFTVAFVNAHGVAGVSNEDDGSGSTTTDASSVTYDRQTPALSAVTISTNNTNPAYAKVGSIITLAFTASDTENLIANPTVTILTNAATVSGSGANWTATYTTQSSNTEGTVPFTIDFTDYAGNSGTTVNAIISGSDVTYDKTIPTLTTASIISNNTNAPSGTLSKVGDIVTLSIIADNNIQMPTVTIAGHGATLGSGSSGESVYTFTWTMSVNDAAASAIAFIIDFSDLASNAGAQVTTLANDSDGGVSFDKQEPSFTTVSIASNNLVSTRAKEGDNIILTLVSDEPLKPGLDPTITIAGNTATVTRNSTISYSASYTMASTDAAFNAQAITYNISSYQDSSGNAGVALSATLDGSSVTYDNTAPELGTVTIASDNASYAHLAKVNDIITLTIISGEHLQADPVIQILGSATGVTVIDGVDASHWTATKTVTGGSAEGAATFNITYADVSGNSGTVVTSKTAGKNVIVDRGTPTITTASIWSDNAIGAELAFPGSQITLDMIASENIIQPTITIANLGTIITDEGDANAATWQGVFTMTGAEASGTIPFEITFEDSAGNAGTNRTTIVNDADESNVSFDKIKPTFSNVTISSNNAAGYDQYARSGSIITLSFEASEDLLSTTVTINNTVASASLSGGTYTALYTITNATGDNDGAGYDVPFTIDATDLNGYGADQVTETLDGTNITFDKTIPTVNALTVASDNANDVSLSKVGNALTLTFVASEFLRQPTMEIAGETAITEVEGGTKANWTGSYTMLNTDSEGDQAIKVEFDDYAGNSGVTSTATTDGSTNSFDRTLPTLDVVTIVSNNIYSDQVAKTGNTLILSIEADEDLKTAPMFTIAGGTPFAATQGDAATDWSGTYIMQAGDTEGVVAFFISFEDLAGNSGVSVVATTNSSIITFDKTATDISSVVVDLVDGSDSGVSNSDNLTNDQTPEFQITGLQPGIADDTKDAVGDSIFFYVDGIQTDLLDGSKGGVPISGTLSLVLSTLAHQELAYEVKVVSRDPAGNLSSFSTPINLRVDTQASSSPSVPNLNWTTDSGFLDTDDITNVQQPTFRIYNGSTDRDSVRLFYNIGASDVLVGGFRKPEDGLTYGYYQVPIALSENVYTFSAVLVDSAGNVSDESGGLDVTIDVTGSDQPNNPDLTAGTDSGFLDSDNITKSTSLSFSVSNLTATDSLVLLKDDVVVTSALIGASTHTITSTSPATGTYTAYSIDIAGNQSIVSGGLDVTVDQAAPNVSLVRSYLSTSSDLGVLDNDNLTNDYTPEIRAEDLIANDSAFLYVDGVLNQRLLADATTMLFTTDSLSDNTHAISIKIQDIAGNLSDFALLTKNAANVSLTHEIRVDTQPPTMPSSVLDLLVEDDTGFDNTDNKTNNTSPRFELVDLPSVPDSIRLFYDTGTGDVLSKAMRMSQGITDTIQIGSALGGDTYSFTYFILDSAGNVSNTSSALSLVVDVSPPSVPNAPDLVAASDFGISSTDNLTSLATPEFIVTGILEGNLASLYYIDVAGDTTLLDTQFVSSDPVTFTSPALTTGNYTFFPVASDTAGNTREGADLSVTIDLGIPNSIISFDGDSLVNFSDAQSMATFTFSEEMDDATIPPTVDVDYPEGTLNDLTDQPLTNINTTTWRYAIPLNTSGLESIDGVIALTLNSSDLAGNIVPVDSITGLSVLRVDNTLPIFSFTDPESGTYVNDKLVGYTLSESVQSGSITWTRLSGNIDDNSPHVVPFDATEIVGSYLYRDYPLINGPDNLVSETYYEVKFSATDSSNNESTEFIETPVYYDTTGSSATVTFSQLFVSADSTVTITATFNERVLPTPTISLDFAGTFNDITDSSMTISDDDSSIWILTTLIPSGIENQGNVGISITAMDLATNTIDTTIITDTLYVDNTVTIADFTYINTSQEDSLGNVGIGDDVIKIIVQMNEPIVVFDPIPALNYSYAGGSGNSVDGMIPQSSSNGDSVWVFEITLQDTIHNDGPLNITLVAKDRSNNDVTNYTNNTLFQVDNYHPADFDMGATTVFGNNAVQGWINGATDSVGVVVPIETNSEDSTLFLGGYTKIQFYNLTRGVAWITVGAQDSLTQAGDDEIFYRTIEEIETAMSPGSDLILGDSLEIRASITDRNGNLTYGAAGTQKLVYDPVAPVLGQINGGNMFTADTLYSNDTLSIKWSAFTDEGDDASGFDQYQLAFEKVGSDSLEDFYGWEQVVLPTVPLEYGLFLEHNEKYIGHIRGFDIAGNLSDTLATDTLVRYNTKPTIATLIDAALNEDISWTDNLALTDPDLFVMQSDSFTYKAITTRLVGNAATDSVRIDTSGVLTWTPTQNDTGTYEIQVIAIDAYAFADTFKLPLVVTAVNDTPVVDILSPDNNLEWIEDDTATVKINLTSYLEDVDNNDSTEITWQAIILDTTQLDEDFPLGRVIVSPGTPWSVHSRLMREYLGFDLNPKGMKSPVISRRTANQINTRNNMSHPLLSVTINTISSGESWAYFNSDSNFYGSDHRIIFIAQDPYGAEDRDTVMVTVLPQNDAPIISEIPLMEVTENDSIYLKFGSFTTDVDDTDLTFTISATTNEDKISISPSTYISNEIGDSVLFLPEKLWSEEATIKLIVTDNDEASDTATFILDVLRVPRPKIKVAVVQNNAFANYLQVIVSDTVSKTKIISLEVQNVDIDLDTIAAFTWAGDFKFDTPGNYSIDVFAIADVGETIFSELIALAVAREASRWFGRSVDGRFSVAGDPGSVSYDQSFIIVDSSLFTDDFNDQASYVLGDEFFEFEKPIEVRFGSQRNDLAIYRRKNGVTWEELPSISKDSEIFTFSEKTGYFKLGPKTIIVPEETNIHQNYPNPFNPLTTIMYDIGLMDGLSQNVSIAIYNLLGQHVKTLIHNKDQVGQFTVQWNGQNQFGQTMSTGVYFVQLTTQTGIVKNKKMMLLK